MGSFASILAALAPVLEPVLLQEWKSQILPALQGSVAKISSPDLQLAAQAAVQALDTIASAEIAKL